MNAFKPLGPAIAALLLLTACGANNEGPAEPATDSGDSVLVCPLGTRFVRESVQARGIRFEVSSAFDAVQVAMRASVSGTYEITAELRSSGGFVTEAGALVRTYQAIGTDEQPAAAVNLAFGPVSVTSPSTFTLKLEVVGPGDAYLLSNAVGSDVCPGAELTNQNDTAEPTPRSDPLGFLAVRH